MFFSAKIIAILLALTYSFGQSVIDSSAKFELRLAELQPAEGLIEATVPYSDEKIYLHKEALITNKDILEAKVVEGDTPKTYNIEIVVNGKGAERIKQCSRAHIGKPMAVLLKGKIISAPTIGSELSVPIVISGQFTKGEAKRIAKMLRGK